MSKELEALENIKFIECYEDDGGHYVGYAKDVYPKELDIIENALNDNHFYHHILDKICKFLSIDISSHRDLIETENEILNTIVKNEHKLKALEIIKEKNVYIPLFKFGIDTYNLFRNEDDQLTQEEYDLLKEVLV